MAETERTQSLVWAMIAVQSASPFITSGVPVTLPSMGSDLNAGATSLSLVVTIYLASQVAFLLPVGRLAASADKQALCKLGLLGFAVSTLAIGLLSSMPVILALSFFGGMSAAVVAAVAPAILADIVPVMKRGRVYGAAMGAVYAGLTLGPMSAGFLTDIGGWRLVFLASGAAFFVLLVVFHRIAPSTGRLRPAAVNLPSSVLALATVACLVAGSATIREGSAGYAYVALGLLLAAAFVVLQGRVQDPLVRLDLLARNRILASALFVQLVLYLNGFSVTFLLSLYMQVSLGHSAELAGQIIAVGTVLMAVTAPLAGRLADRYQPHLIASLGVACVLVSTLMGVIVDERTGLLFVFLILAVQGMGWALFSSPNMAIIMNSVTPQETSIASALGATARSLGMLSGMIIAGIFISLSMGNDAIGQHPNELIWTVAATCAVLAIVTAIVLVISIVTAMSAARSSQIG